MTTEADGDTEGGLISSASSWKALREHVTDVKKLPLGMILTDADSDVRNRALRASYKGLFLDFSHQIMTLETTNLLFDLAEQANVQGKIREMAAGEQVNRTEKRAVLHIALRADKEEKYEIDGRDVVPLVHDVLANIRDFTERVFNGKHRGGSHKKLTDILCVGIGGSYLGADFVSEAFRCHPEAAKMSKGRQLRFLANVDPVAVERALHGLEPSKTLIIIISKSFTTSETMKNARVVREWLIRGVGRAGVARQMVAISASPEKCKEFGIAEELVFEMWDWVGGRFSVCSAVGVLPLSLMYGFKVVAEFLAGARSIDQNFLHASPRENLALIMGLIGVWNTNFLAYSSRAILPYSEALSRFPAHIQQVEMESNGKRVAVDGSVLDYESGPVVFGEPGTNGQHSFYQLIHQGRVIPCDFIGFVRSQVPQEHKSDEVSGHDELMSNFFAQPDALAYGRSQTSLQEAGVPSWQVPHRVFEGNRPSLSILFPVLNPFTTGQLLALYEHETAVQGFIWGINSFDQFGVELGKKEAKKARDHIIAARNAKKTHVTQSVFNSSTEHLLNLYLTG